MEPGCTQPGISVLIPAFNEEVLIARVIGSVQAAFQEAGFASYEIVLCDNNSSDNTARVASDLGARVVFEPHNQIARARNTAAKAARGKWFIFLDGDSFVNSDLIRETIDCFQSGVVCAGGAVLKFDRERIHFFPALMTRLWNRVSSLLNLAAGSYLFCYETAWREVGGFDEQIYAGEELFFSQSLKRWAKAHKLRFRVLTRFPITTSARKLDWHSPMHLFMTVLRMARPGSLKNREMCDLWYKRPGSN